MQITQYYTAASIDGFVADANNSLDWLVDRPPSTEHDDGFATFFAGVGAMAMGATTYEWVLRHEQPEKWHEYYGDVPCWVFTHRELPPIAGADLTFTSADVREVHAEMARRAGDKNIWMVGGGNLAGQWAAAGLIDQLVVGIVPVTLGAGAPLLPWRSPGDLRLLSAERHGDFVQLSYDLPAAG